MQYFNSKGQLVAESKDDILYKRVVRSKHLMKIFDGYGIDKDIFDKLDVKEIWLRETDTDKVYKSTIEDWKEHGIIKNFEGEQIFLPLKNWSIKN